MDITLHEKNHGQTIVNLESFEDLMMGNLKPSESTIKNILAYSEALSVKRFDCLGNQETILN